MAQNYDFATSGWPAAAPATGGEQVFGLDAGGNLAAMPLSALRRPGWYRQDGLILPKWRKARAGAANGSRRGTIVVAGTSVIAGAGAGTGSGGGTASFTAAKPLAIPTRLAAALSQAGVPAIEASFVGDNQVRAVNNVPVPNYDPRLVFAGGFDASNVNVGNPISQGICTLGGSLLVASTSGATLKFTPTVAVDTFAIFYASNTSTGSFTTTIDSGTTSSAINTSAGSQAIGFASATAASPGIHSLTLTTTSSAGVYIIGIIAYNSTQSAINVINAGRSGGLAVDSTTGSTVPWNPLQSLAYFAPDLTILEFGINEWRTSGYSLSTYTTAMQAWITAAKASGDVMLLVPFPSQTTGSFGTIPVAQQQAFQQALYQLSITNNVPLLDLTYMFGSGAAANSNGFCADQLHPLSVGHQDIAQQVANFLMAA